MLDNDELAALVRSEIQMAEGFDDDAISENRREALNYYYGRPRGDEVEGSSEAQSLDVADMTEAILANVMPAFAADTLGMFEPDSEEDEQQADMESRVVSNMIMERNRGFWELQEAIKNALLLRNAIMKVYVEETVTVTIREVEGTEITIAASLSQRQDNEERELVSVEQVTNTFGQTFVVGRIRSTVTERVLKVEATDPTMFLIQPNHDSIFLEGLRFCAERSYPTRSELITRGFDKAMVNELPSMNWDDKTDTQARRRDNANVDRLGSLHDDSEAVIEMYECFYRVDVDEDGVSELHRIHIAGNKILDDEIAEFIPYATGTAICNPHQYNSISLFDRLRMVQDVKTRTLRQWLDNLDANNNISMVVVEGQVNMDDATLSRPGKIVRARSIDAVRELPIMDLGSSSKALLDYADKMRSERGGAALDLQSAEAQLAGDTAHGIERQFSSREQLASLMARNLSETLIRSLYLLVHQTMRLFMPGEVTMRIGNEFASVDPGTWPARTRMNIKTGLSLGERAHKRQVMQEITSMQMQMSQAGFNGTMVTQGNLHSAITDWMRAAAIDNPERYFTDPDSETAAEAAKQKQQQAEQASQDQKQQEFMIFGMQNQIAEQSNQIKAMADQMAHQMAQAELQFQYFKEQLGAEIEEAKIVGKSTADLLMLKEKGQQESEHTHANSGQRVN